jgi:hypothetical protein
VSTHLSVSTGNRRTFTVAGTRFALLSELPSGALRLPASFGAFETPSEARDVEVRIGSRERLAPGRGALLFDSKLHWRALRTADGTTFEFHHPPSSTLYCRASVDSHFEHAKVLFSEEAMRRLSRSEDEVKEWHLPYPLDQLLLVPALALRGTVLLHACGAVVAKQGVVFAGHSGDGKTTLARLLSEEGLPLLSDERIAIRSLGRGSTVFGTPWPGEGNVVSSASHPLRALFVLRKAPEHAVASSTGSLVPEVLARAIVPYYLPPVAAKILQSLSELAAEVPFRELRFARSPGLGSLLERVA